MKDGSFHASGSPLFLKQRFQLPCTLSVVSRKRDVFDKTGSAFELSFQGLGAKLMYTVGNTYKYRIPQDSLLTITTILDSLDRFVQENVVASIEVETGSLSELCCMISEDADDLSTNSTAASTANDDQNPPYDSHAKVKGARVRVGVDVLWITQVTLMCWKRWQIRKRRVFGLVRHLLIFAALVALSLGILVVPIRHQEYTLGLSPGFSTPHEGSSLYVGGGATLTNPYTSSQVMIDKLTAIEAALATDETSVNVKNMSSVRNSGAMSNALYTLNNTDALGAFVLFDAIPFHWDVNWPFYQKYLVRLQSAYEMTVGNFSLQESIDLMGFETPLGNATLVPTDTTREVEMVSAVVTIAVVISKLFFRLWLWSTGLSRRQKRRLISLCNQSSGVNGSVALARRTFL
jgi:hypothetical protein